jgi:hypothetical protein
MHLSRGDAVSKSGTAPTPCFPLRELKKAALSPYSKPSQISGDSTQSPGAAGPLRDLGTYKPWGAPSQTSAAAEVQGGKAQTHGCPILGAPLAPRVGKHKLTVAPSLARFLRQGWENKNSRLPHPWRASCAKGGKAQPHPQHQARVPPGSLRDLGTYKPWGAPS